MSKIRIGLFGARMDNTGLGAQTWEFYKHIKPDKTFVIDTSDTHPERKQYWDRYPEAMACVGTPDVMMITEFLKDLDVVFCMETPYNYDLFAFARAMGVKTILQYNWEFLDYLQNPNLPIPDLFASPSMWNYNNLPFVNKTFLPVPVNREVIKFKRRKSIKTILHIAGPKLHADRNGTEIFMRSLPLLDPKLKVIIYTQHKIEMPELDIKCKVEIRKLDMDNYFDLYKEGDILVMPRRYGGLCLPLNESMAAGMIPVMTKISPQVDILHPMSLIPAFTYKDIETRVTVRAYEISPELLAEKINHIARCDSDIIENLSEFSNDYAKMIDWNFLEKLYRKIFETLVEGNNVTPDKRTD